MKKKIVIIGGGTGLPITLKALRKISNIKIFAIPTVFDSGGDTGYWRKQYKIPAIGDIRRCFVALGNNKKVEELMNYRFKDDHHLGNMVIMQYVLKYGFKEAIQRCKKLLNIRKHEIIPVSLDSVMLLAKNSENKEISEGEINNYVKANVKEISFDKEPKLNPKIFKVLKQADYVIISPGSLYSSILSNLKVIGKDLLNIKRSKKIWICNLHTEPGETQGLTLQDHYSILNEYIDKFNYILINNNFDLKLKDRKYLDGGLIAKSDNIIRQDFVTKDKEDWTVHSVDKLKKVLEKIII